MQTFCAVMALIMGFILIAALVGTGRGDLPADRMIAGQLIGSMGVALLLLLAEAMGAPALRDVALVIAVLSSIATLAFVRLRAGGNSS